MGAGCLALVNDTPENREVLGGAGLVYRFNEPDSLAACSAKSALTEKTLRAFKSRAQERVSQCYDWESVVDEYEKLFAELRGGLVGCPSNFTSGMTISAQFVFVR